MKSSVPIAAAAAALFAGSIVILCGTFVLATNAVESYRQAGQSLSGMVNGRLFAFAVLPLAFSFLGIIVSVGLFGLREWARKAAIFLSVAPVGSCALLVLFRPESIFPADVGLQYAILTIGSMGIVMYGCMLVILIPVSAWWLILFTRESVRSQFR